MIRFPSETLQARAEKLAAHFQVVRPDGAGPFPTIVMLHGCGKSNGPQVGYAQAAADAGFASIIVNSYAPRQISQAEAIAKVCTGFRLWGRERAGDLLAALHWARGQDWVDPDNLAAAGWSHGAWSIMDGMAIGKKVALHAAITDLPEDPLKGVRHLFLVYPWCGTGTFTAKLGWRQAIATTMLLGERDTLVGQRKPRLASEAMIKSGVDLTLVQFPNATHSFDEKDTGNPTFVYDEGLARQAHSLFVTQLSRYLTTQ